MVTCMGDLSNISKSRFKARALQYFREVEASGEALIITDRGKPVLKLVPYEQGADVHLARFRGLIVRYDRPLDPVAVDDWDALA